MERMQNDECGMMNLEETEYAVLLHSSFIIHHSSFTSDEEDAFARNRLALTATEELP